MSIRTLLPALGLVACVQPADPPSSTTEAAESCSGDYCEVQRFRFEAGGGFQLVAPREYCGRSGYPDGVVDVIGLEPRDVIALPLEGGDFVLFGDRGDSAVVRRYDVRGEDCAVGVSAIRFADGTTWNTGRRFGPPANVPIDRSRVVEGSSRRDRLYGTRRVDALIGHEGDDRLYGYEEDDVLSGGAGSDRLYGGDGDDILLDGPGDDLLAGGAGRDIYLVDNLGLGGTETIDDTSGDSSVVFVGTGIHNDDEALWTRERDDLALSFSRVADRVVFRDYFGHAAQLASVALDNLVLEGLELDARLRDARQGTAILRYRDSATGLVQASPSGYTQLACATSSHPASLGTLPLVVLNSSGRPSFREVTNDCGSVARLVGDAIVGTVAPACPSPGTERTCQIVVDALVDGRRTAPVTLSIYTSSFL